LIPHIPGHQEKRPKGHFTLRPQYEYSAISLFRNALIFLAIVIMIGSLGFSHFEGWPLLDSIYFTVVFLSTIGLGDLHPATEEGKIFATFIAISGVGLVAYSVGQFSRIMVNMEIQKTLGRRKLKRLIQNLTNHYVICGYGHVGSIICRELFKGNVPFVIVEKDPEVIEHLKNENEKFLFIHGDATDDKCLIEANVSQAKGLATTTRNDAENVYIILTAKDLNSQIHLISLAMDVRSGEKLRRAGADLVISPSEIGGRRIVQGIVRPSVMNFIDLAVFDSSLELQMEQIIVPNKSSLIGSTLTEQAIRQKFDVIVLGIITKDGKMHFNPDPNYEIKSEDTLIALGKQVDMRRMSQIIC